MVETSLRATAPLHHPSGEKGASLFEDAVAIREITDFQMVSLASAKGGLSKLIEAVQQYWGVNLPLTPKYVPCGPLAFIWAGPDRWMVTSSQSEDLEQTLRHKLGASPAITDQSDSRSLLRLSGPGARTTLAKLLTIDLHPRVFVAGDTALTSAIHINLQIWQLDNTPTYDLCVFRSYADHFYHALCVAAAATA